MLCRVCDEGECDRSKWLFLCLLFAFAMVMLGLAIGFLIDWLQGRLP